MKVTVKGNSNEKLEYKTWNATRKKQQIWQIRFLHLILKWRMNRNR